MGLHERQIERYGGGAGIRDRALLESAVAMPGASFGGTWLHGTVEEMAAAYLFHLCQNHPFIDGNKRTAAMAMVVFLVINDVTPLFSADELVELTLSVAAGQCTKAQAAIAISQRTRRG